MKKILIDEIKQLRQATGISVAECKKALEAAQGDMEKAKDLLRVWEKKVVEKKHTREVGQGLVETYQHPTGKVGSLVEVRCETDFVVRSEDFKNLAHELAMQVASMNPEDVDALMDQQYIRDPSKRIRDLVGEHVARLGENIKVERIVRFDS